MNMPYNQYNEVDLQLIIDIIYNIDRYWLLTADQLN